MNGPVSVNVTVRPYFQRDKADERACFGDRDGALISPAPTLLKTGLLRRATYDAKFWLCSPAYRFAHVRSESRPVHQQRASRRLLQCGRLPLQHVTKSARIYKRLLWPHSTSPSPSFLTCPCSSLLPPLAPSPSPSAVLTCPCSSLLPPSSAM